MKLSVRSALSAARDSFRSQLWPIPTVGVVVAVALGILIPYVDVIVDRQLPGWFDEIIFNGGPGAARTLLDAVASSLITVTALTFSLTVVTLQLASSQFSPRLLRTFTQDIVVQVTLALFLATFTYWLTVLRSVRSSAESVDVSFVPRIAVTTSFLLALASVVALVLFLSHLTRQTRVETMLRSVRIDASATVAANLNRRGDETPIAQPRPIAATRVFANGSGFLVRINLEKLLRVASDDDIIIAFDREPGDFVVAGTPIAAFWCRDGGTITGRDDVERIRNNILAAVRTGVERTAGQDVGYGFRQLTDVAVKALSPGINDPTTAVHALGHTSSLLVELMGYQLGPMTLLGEGSVPRVILARSDFAKYLEVALTQPRRYGASDQAVVVGMYRLFEDLAWNTPAEYRTVISDHVRYLRDAAAEEDYNDAERAAFADLDLGVLTVLSGAIGKGEKLTT